MSMRKMQRPVAFNIFFSYPTAKLAPAVDCRLSQCPPSATLRGILIKLISAAERREDILHDKQVRSSMFRSYFHSKPDQELRDRRALLIKRCKAYLKHYDAESRYARIINIKKYLLSVQNEHKAAVAAEIQEGKEAALRTLDVTSTWRVIHAGIRRDILLMNESLRARNHVDSCKFQGKMEKEYSDMKRLALKSKSVRKQRQAALNRLAYS